MLHLSIYEISKLYLSIYYLWSNYIHILGYMLHLSIYEVGKLYLSIYYLWSNRKNSKMRTSGRLVERGCDYSLFLSVIILRNIFNPPLLAHTYSPFHNSLPLNLWLEYIQVCLNLTNSFLINLLLSYPNLAIYLSFYLLIHLSYILLDLSTRPATRPCTFAINPSLFLSLMIFLLLKGPF